ncbi:Pentatricopeptide repeat-containing protein [Heracleum sosnowskyi]|uniref:Pentatricopeptide repeat-containing protein n=1 Tax=Heracleum sosnowskyi TaxID=360622 RepID=A0AAD8GY87_9APIA|nr:Pentatricopeptide repeat-containing protein [Heracleum sosnowskyi]
MFVKLQNIDTSSFHKLYPIQTPITSVPISISPQINTSEHQSIKKQHLILVNSVGVAKKSSTSNGNRIKTDVAHQVFVRKSDRNEEDNGGMRKVRDYNGEFRDKDRVHTKWARYGGRIAAMLEALERVKDLDKALRPWKDTLGKKERTIILKEQTCWKRSLEIFEWFKMRGCYEVNVIHYNIMLRTLGKAGIWNKVERLWDEMRRRGVTPKNSTYGTLIDVYSKGGHREKALNWFVLMQKQGMEPDEVTMAVVVQMYKKAGEFRKAEHFFKIWSADKYCEEKRGTSAATNGAVDSEYQVHICLSSYTYNTLIDTYGKSGQLKEASETFAWMLREGIAPTTVTFNTMIHIFGNHGKLGEVTSLMQTMDQLGCLPDTRTYNILISLHTKHDNIELAADCFRKMKEAALEPDLVSYRTLLYAFSIRHMVSEAETLVSEMDNKGLEIDEFTQSALTRMYIEANMLNKSWDWFNRFHVVGNMTSECYSANIDAFGERGHILEAEKVFRCCQEKNSPTVLEFNVMIKAFGLNKRYDQACQLIDSMEGQHGVVADRISYNSLIQMLANAELPHIARSYLRKMQEVIVVNDCIPYCAVISSYIRLNQLEEAVSVFREMIDSNVHPDVIVYDVLINAFADIGNVNEALHYVNAVREMGLSMNGVIYNSVIKLYTKVGCLKEAEEAYHMLLSSEMGADVYSSNCMIDLYSKRSMVEQAEEIFDNLRVKGIANEFSYAMMLCMYKKLERIEDAIQVAEKMKELGLLTDLLSYNHVLGLYATDGRFKEAIKTFREMLKSGVQPDDSTLRSIGVVLVKRGVPKQTVNNLEVMWKKDQHNGLKEWTDTLYSMDVKADDDDEIYIADDV